MARAKATSDELSHRALWRAQLGSALRTAVACAAVGMATLYGPARLRSVLSYPAFSYVTTILIVSEATLGDALRGFCHVAYATAQVVLPAMLSLRLIGPARFTDELAAVAVALSAFVVALPASTPLLCKRIAFGQIVLVYVGAVVEGAEGRVFMHPIHVAASTALGASASVLALLLPFPKLACCEVRRDCRSYAENAAERVDLIMEAISAQESTAAQEFISHELCLSRVGAKLLQRVEKNLGGMSWERPQIKIMNPDWRNLGGKLRDMELPMKGMEIALSSCPVFPIGMMDQESKQVLQMFKDQVGLKLEHAKCFVPFDATTAPEGKSEASENQFWNLKTSSTTAPENLSAFFLLYCMQLLQDDPPIAPNTITPKLKIEEPNETLNTFQRAFRRAIKSPLSSHNFAFAIKCSISLGLAVFVGLIYNRVNGYWSGLTIAISFTTGRQPTFIVANARAQGTAMGSVYGVLCVFLFERCLDFRFLTLLPWIIFTSFLIHSRTYGQAGAFSAVIGALLIVGRKDYGSPTVFAIARITEATIGILCFILVEVLLNPARAATLAKSELSLSMGVLKECVQNIRIVPPMKDVPASALFHEKQHQLKFHVNELEKFIAEAEIEPNFWFLPFNGVSYRKLLGSLTKLVTLLHFVTYQIEVISKASDLGDLMKKVNDDLENFNQKVGSSQLRRLEEATSITALQVFKKELQKKGSFSHDIEMGKSTYENAFRTLGRDDKDVENILSCFLLHLEELVPNVHTYKSTGKLMRQVTLSLTAFGFCIHSLAKEVRQIENEVRELIKWENPKM